ncbi:type IV toxin-antitoxin system AbiEi family antitoxin domain-containing protein [Actinoplanes sp. NPDC026670]|uniref:type IV toxin-antitoxin system AbiEi family antitoxin domain-containing protein n=1 Tax=Actinoplanes sp. NPDC026670 TaxID=3154700 RepID=UPI0033C2BDEA
MNADQSAFRVLLDQQHRVITRVQALEHLSRGAIEHRLDSGRWQNVHRGVYVAHSGPLGRNERQWIAVLGTVGGHIAWLGGLTALERLGFQGFAAEPIHVLIPARAYTGRPPTDVVVHRSTRLPTSDVRSNAQPPATTAARSLIDAAQWQPSPEQAAVIILSGFQQRLARTEDVAQVLANMPRARHRAVINDAVRDAASGVTSLPEAEFLRLCRSAGLPEPVMQHRRRDTAGRVNYLDAYFPAHRLHVEIDGAHHQNVQQWWADMQRQNALWIPGDRVLRFPAWAIRNRPAEVAAQLRAALTIHPTP